jgi:hypothetical protein
MTHATITTELDLEIDAEIDGDYWRYEDEKIQDLTLCALYVYEPWPGTARHDLLKGLDRPSRLCVERNLLAIAGMTKRVCEDIEALGEDLHIEPDHDPKDDL